MSKYSKYLNFIKFDISIVLILINLLVYLIDSSYPQLLEKFEFKVQDNSSNPMNILYMIISFFRHRDIYHLLGNMITLFSSSRDIYTGGIKKDPERKSKITSWKDFLLLYFISGIIGTYFEIFIYYFLNTQWQSEKDSYSNQYKICNNFFCDYIKSGAGLIYSLFNYKKLNALNEFSDLKIIGAESCIYGNIGAELIRKTFSSNNYFNYVKISYKESKQSLSQSRYFDLIFNIVIFLYNTFGYLTLIFDLFSKFLTVPWNINSLLNIVFSNKIAHNSHIGGAITGMILMHLYLKYN
jgi:membrane associated rhomboid family serine protease